MGMADSGEVMAAACWTITSMASSVSGGSFQAFHEDHAMMFSWTIIP